MTDHERAGTGHDEGAAGHELQGRSGQKPKTASKPRTPKAPRAAKTDDRKVMPGRMVKNVRLTIDEEHAAKHGGKPFHKPAKTVGRQLELHDRVKIHTPNPIDGHPESFGYVIGFNERTGNPNIRIEALTPALATVPRDFGNVPQNKPEEPNGAYWVFPDGAGVGKE
jgi:hypothetical protein